MATESGKDGKIMLGAAELAEITLWRFKTSAKNLAYASSASGGFKKRLRGVKEGAGYIAFKIDPTDPITDQLTEGDNVTLLLHLDDANFYSVPAVIESLTLEVDIDTGDVVGGAADFATTGAWTIPSFGG